jgi:hypothetical protein
MSRMPLLTEDGYQIASPGALPPRGFNPGEVPVACVGASRPGGERMTSAWTPY